MVTSKDLSCHYVVNSALPTFQAFQDYKKCYEETAGSICSVSVTSSSLPTLLVVFICSIHDVINC